MIDTIRFGIPLSLEQYHYLFNLVHYSDRFQWAKVNLLTDERQLVRVRGLIDSDQKSFKRDFFWDIPEHFEDEKTFLVMELSLPKFWYRHNIWLLHNFWNALDKLKELLEKQLEIEFVDWREWELFRLDICYAWKCPSEEIARALINSLKKLKYPRKKPHIYEDSIMFSAPTYSLKFYLKYPEFMHHDYKTLKKQNIGQDNLKILQNEAQGVLRCEATLRRQYLKYKDISCIYHLLNGTTEYFDDEELKENYPDLDDAFDIRRFISICIHKYNNPGSKIIASEEEPYMDDDECEKFWMGGYFYAPKFKFEMYGEKVEYKGGGFTSIFTPNFVEILNTMIGRLIGEHRGIDKIDEIKEKLQGKYIQSKSSSLIAFWISIQREGSNEVKKIFGNDKYYRYVRDLREAGIGVVEPVRVINAAERFRKDFKFEIPSQFIVNEKDHARGSEDILKFPPQKKA